MKGSNDRGPACRTPGGMGKVPCKPGREHKIMLPNKNPSVPSKGGDRGPVQKQKD